jgi:transaldolase
VTAIYNYYKEHDYKTVVMGASFRSIDEILEIAGCDRLTIAPQLLQALEDADGEVVRKLVPTAGLKAQATAMTHDEFLWEHNQDAMAVEKLAEGIRSFAVDQGLLEEMLLNKL